MNARHCLRSSKLFKRILSENAPVCRSQSSFMLALLKNPRRQSTNNQKMCFSSSHGTFASFGFWRDKEKKIFQGQKIKTGQKSYDGTSLLDRYIFVKTLEAAYEDVPNGIILDTHYGDSKPGEDFDRISPVVVGLHDTPGSHHDLKPILDTFAKLGCRTIAPTFPGHGKTQGLMKGFDDVFSHSTLDKAIFVHDFLQDLEIERVDLLIGVGAGCYPALRLCAGGDNRNVYKSMALISPWPFLRPRYEPNPELTRRIQFLWDRPFFRPPVRLMLPAYKFGDIQSAREKITAAYLLNNLDLGEAGGLALAASSMNLPRIVVFGELDHAVEKELYEDVVEKLEIPKANVSSFKGKLDAARLPGALVFPEGGYDLHIQHPGIISAFLLSLIKLFHPHIHI